MPIRRGRFAPQNTFLETIAQKFDHGNSNFVLGSAQEKNNYPIVYCSDGFCELTGFSRSELMRRSCACNFLYGLESNQDDIQNIQNALKIQKELKKEVLFYKKNGSPFFCLLDIVPIKNEKGNVVLFLVSHKDVNKRNATGEVHDHDDEENSTAPSDRGNPGGRKLTRSRSRKFSRDVLLHLSRQYQQTNSASKPQARRTVKRARSFSFNSERLPLYKRDTTKKSKLLFLHYSNIKGLWDWWVLILTFYIAIMVPYNVAFSRNGKTRDLIIVDMVIELFFIFDIVVHFRTTYVNNAGRIVYDQKAIAIHYLKGWFILDFLAALPFEALYFINQSWDSSPFDSQGSAYNEGFLVQLLKCGRLLRLFRVVRKLHRYTEYSTVLLSLLMLAFAMVAHWLACVWYVIGLEEVHGNSTISWLYQFGETIQMPFVDFSPDTGPDEASAYVTALYFTLTSMTTVGFGNVSANTNAEKAFSVVVMLIGALMHAAIFGNVAAIIQKLYANRVRYHSRSNEIKQFIRVHHIEPDLANRLEDYFHTTWSLSGGVDTREILITFPTELQADVCMHLYRGLLDLPVFSQAPRGLYRMLSLQVNPVYLGPGEYLLTQNDVINSIYYIASGSMEVLQGESVAAILGKGDLFGEDISRKTPIRRSNGDVRALTYCDVYYITRDKLQDVLHLYPDFTYKFADKLELTYDLGASERDIWRRGGLDSISEDEEEEEDEADSPLTDKENTAASPVRNRFDFNSKLNLPLHKRTNNFKANEPWSSYSQVQVKRPNRLNIRGQRSPFSEEQPLLARPCNDYHNNGLGVHGNETPEDESKSDTRLLAPESVLSDPSLEWEQESFTLKEEQTSDQSTNELDRIPPEAIEEEEFEVTDMGCESLKYVSHRPNTSDSSLKFDKESFLKQLQISADEEESEHDMKTTDTESLMQNSEPGIGTFSHAMSTEEKDVEFEQEAEEEVEHNNEDLIGFTEFSTPVHSPRRCRRARFTRAAALSTPTCLLTRDRSVSPASSYTGSLKNYPELEVCREVCREDDDFNLPSEVTNSNSTLTSKRCVSPAASSNGGSLRDSVPRQRRDTLDLTHIENGRVSPQRKRSISPLPESPYVSIRRLFSQSPSQRSPCSSMIYESLEDSYDDDAAASLEPTDTTTQSVPRNPLRRGYTDGSVHNEDKPRPAADRRRKMSAVMMQPPAIFASLVAQASSPYADFVPPNVLRESSIMCNCDEDESCSSCRGTCTQELSSTEDCHTALLPDITHSDVRCSNESLSKLRKHSFESASSSSQSTNCVRNRTDCAKELSDSNSSKSNAADSTRGRRSAESLSADYRSDLPMDYHDSSILSTDNDRRDTVVNNNPTECIPMVELRSNDSIQNSYEPGYVEPCLHSICNQQEPSEHRCTSPGLLFRDGTRGDTCSTSSSGLLFRDGTRGDTCSTSSSSSNHDLRKTHTGISDERSNDVRNDVTNDPTITSTVRRKSRKLTLIPDGARYQVSNDFQPLELQNCTSTLPGKKYQFETDSSESLSRSQKAASSSSDDMNEYFNPGRPEGAYIPPFFDEVSSSKGMDMTSNTFIYDGGNSNTLYAHESGSTCSFTRSSFTPVTSIRSPKTRTSSTSNSSVRTSAMSLDNISMNELPQRYRESISSHPVRKPTLSGIHSVYSLQSLLGNDAIGDLSSRRPMRTSFSEPHLNARYFQNENFQNRTGMEEEYSDVQLEDIFQDVASTKEAMERLQMILKSPEPDLCSELTDTRETVKRLDRQVLHLNEDVASLSKDVKTVLELLKGLKNGQVEPSL